MEIPIVGLGSQFEAKAKKGLLEHLDQALLDEAMIVDLYIGPTDQMTATLQQIDKLHDLVKGPGTASMTQPCLHLVSIAPIVLARRPTISILDISHPSKLQLT